MPMWLVWAMIMLGPGRRVKEFEPSGCFARRDATREPAAFPTAVRGRQGWRGAGSGYHERESDAGFEAVRFRWQ